MTKWTLLMMAPVWLAACNAITGADDLRIVADDPVWVDDASSDGGGSGGDTTAASTTTVSVGAGGGGAGAGGEEPVGGNGQPPPRTPVYRVPLRVHVGESQLPESELRAVLEEINWIWWSQAAVCFEMHTVSDDTVQSDGFDIWFVQSLGNVNGYYSGDHDIWSVDYPSLSSSPNPTNHPASRTAAHEVGHGLTLNHYNGQPDSNDSLMSSGTKGWGLHASEISSARSRAAEMAISDTMPLYCDPPLLQ